MTFRTLAIRRLTIRSFALCATLMLAHAAVASAQTVTLEFLDGRVNLSAQNAPIRVILAEWARLGGTRIVNGDRVTGAPVTLELKNHPERDALDIVLRGVPGYMITARQTAAAGSSHFDRIMVLPVATQARPTSSVAAFTPPMPRAIPDDDSDIDDDVEDITALRRADQEALRRAEELARQRALEQAGRVVGQPVLGDQGAGPVIRQPTPFLPAPQPAQVPTAGAPPMPGQVARPSNPFNTLPGSARPGEITTAPQENRAPNLPDEAER
jgi:hypothetical protein